MRIVFHVGLHKTATTWLQSGFFTEHPEIQLVTDYKKPWNDPFLNYLVKANDFDFQPDKCRKLLYGQLALTNKKNAKVFLVSAERLSGHPYSGGYDTLRLARRIRDTFPKAWVILGIRNQKDLLISIYKQSVKDGYRGTLSDMLITRHWQIVGFDMDIYKYDSLIRTYWRYFSIKRVLVLVHEDLREDSNGFLRNISSFLNVREFIPTNTGVRMNWSPPDHATFARRVLNQFRKSELNPFPVVNISSRTFRALEFLFSPFFKGRELFSDTELNKIAFFYHESNDRLRRMLKRNLISYP